jgi:hypothetical protein
MKRAACLLCAALVLGGCLEVEQHPVWRDGQYAGKTDALPPQLRFHGDRLAWTAVIHDRTGHQDEYRRHRP